MENQIAKTESGDGETEKRHPHADLQPTPIHRPRSWLLPVAVTGGVAAIGGAGFWWLLWASQTFDRASDAVTFVTGGSLTLAILLVAVVQACVYWSQRGWMGRQWGEMQKQAKSMDQSVVYGLRAYVGVHSPKNDFDNRRILLYIENVGKVPANDIRVGVELTVTISQNLLPLAIDPPEGWTEIDPDSWTRTISVPNRYGKLTKLFPGMKIEIVVPFLWEHFSPQQMAVIKEEKAQLAVRGQIRYSDGFNSGKNTDFAFEYVTYQHLWLAQPVNSPIAIIDGPEKSDEEKNHKEESRA